MTGVRNLTLLLAITIAGRFVVQAQSQTPPAGAIALRGATLISGAGDATIPDSVIVIQGDKIVAFGGRNTSVPTGATVIDLAGKFIIPGLIDSHVHYEEWMGELFLNHGVTTAMGIGTDLPRVKTASSNASYRTPRLYDSAGRPDFNGAMSEDQVRKNVRAWIEKKPDFTKMPDYNDSTKAAYAWAADEIHRAGLMIFGHTENAVESVGRGLDVIEHLWGFAVPQMTAQEHDDFQTGKYLHWAAFLRDTNRTEQMMREVIAGGAYLNPTQLYEMGSFSPRAAEFEQEVYQLLQDQSLAAYYPQSISHSVMQRLHEARNFSKKYENKMMMSHIAPADLVEFKAGYEISKRFVKRWVELGGKIHAGTDTVTGGTVGLGLHQEMEMLVEAGLTPMQALQSATIWSAEKLAGKKGARGNPLVGTLAAGSFADLVVLSADPLRDIRNTRKIERVMKAGEFIKLGYTSSYYSFTQTPRRISGATPTPEISAIAPHTVVEGSADFELTVRGVGYTGSTVVKVNGVAVPTSFVNPRTLRAKVPGAMVRSALPNPFNAPGPLQNNGVFGDPTIPVTTYNPPPEGGTSNSISLRIRAKWMGLENE